MSKWCKMYCDSLFHFSVTKRFHRNGGFDMLLTENKEGFVVIDDSVLVSIVSSRKRMFRRCPE